MRGAAKQVLITCIDNVFVVLPGVDTNVNT
jgi:hypothetical protein